MSTHFFLQYDKLMLFISFWLVKRPTHFTQDLASAEDAGSPDCRFCGGMHLIQPGTIPV